MLRGEKERRDGKGERRPAEKRANAGKIGGGSQQLLAGMSGNAWDSDPKGPTTTNVASTRGPLSSARSPLSNG